MVCCRISILADFPKIRLRLLKKATKYKYCVLYKLLGSEMETPKFPLLSPYVAYSQAILTFLELRLARILEKHHKSLFGNKPFK